MTVHDRSRVPQGQTNAGSRHSLRRRREPACRARRSHGQIVRHLFREIGLRARDPEVRRPLVGHRQQPADTARDRVSLVSGGSARAPNSSREACLCSMRSRPAAARCSGTSSARISRARAPAHRPRRPHGRNGAGWRRRSWPGGWPWHGPRGASAAPPQASTDSCAPSRVSSAPMASPSRTTTRSTPRTSRALAAIDSRRAAPTRASAASDRGRSPRARTSAGLRQRAVRQERARARPPRRRRWPPRPPAGQPADRAAPAVDETRLAGQLVTARDHATT